MPLLALLLLVVAAVAVGYQLGHRNRPVVTTYYEPATPPRENVVPLRPVGTGAEDREQVVEAAQELGRWLETAAEARETISPATWDRIAEASSRIADAAARLSTRTSKE